MGAITVSSPDTPWVGDHLALDLLNTEARSAEGVVDQWQTGNDVLHWLAQAGIAAPSAGAADRAELLAQANKLRTLARRLITRHKDGAVEDVRGLNAYLHACLSTPHLARGSDGALTMSRVARGDTIANLLGPVAEAVAQLLVEGDFTLVRQCEHPDCILWFYDRTKAHKRRWCSMAVCGNRYKAAQFRKKSSGGAAL